MNQQQFVLAVCNPGNEDLLKAEVKLRFPFLLLSFSRSGLISFKNSGGALTLKTLSAIDLYFSRRTSLFVAKGSDAEMKAMGEKLAQESGAKAHHFFSFSTLLSSEQGIAERGAPIINYYEITPGTVWISTHLHVAGLSPRANGHYDLALPQEAPSRAWLKMAEAESRFSLMRAADRILELGSAPGGVTYYLLSKRMKVMAVDPGIMAPICFNDPHCHHIKVPVQYCERKHFGEFPPQWMVVDMNLSAGQSVDESARLAKLFLNDLLGIYLTIKVPSPKVIESMPHLLKLLSGLGLVKYRILQLEAHKREILLVGITQKAITRGCDL